MQEIEIGDIGNYYGDLTVKKESDGRCYWSIEDHDGHHWEEITAKLYNALIEFEEQRLAKWDEEHQKRKKPRLP